MIPKALLFSVWLGTSIGAVVFHGLTEPAAHSSYDTAGTMILLWAVNRLFWRIPAKS